MAHEIEEPLYEDGYSTELIANEAIRIIENKDKIDYLFLYVAFKKIQALKKYRIICYIEDPLDRAYAANVNALDTEIGKIIHTIEGQEKKQ